MKLGVKGRKAISYAKKGFLVAGAVGSLVGMGKKATHKVEEKVERKIEEVKEDADVAGVVAGAVIDAGVQAGKDALANPLQAKKKIDLGKDKVVALGKVGEVVAGDRTARQGFADAIDFQKNPLNPPEPRVKRDSRYVVPDGQDKAKVRDSQRADTLSGLASGGGRDKKSIEGMINLCEHKYKKKKGQGNERRKCKKRVKEGGRP